MIQNKTLLNSLLAMIYIAMLGDITLLFSSPFWLNAAYEFGYSKVLPIYEPRYSEAVPSGSYPLMLTFIIICGIVILFALFEGTMVLTNIKKGMPFCRKNAHCFKRAAIYSFILSFAFFAKMIFSSSLLTLLCACFLFAGALLLLVLSQLFGLAAKIKEENELTI